MKLSTSEVRKKILFLCPFIPCEGVHGGGEAMFGFIKWLSNEYDITVLTFVEKEEGLKYREPLEKFCKRVETVITSGLFSFDWQVRSCIKQQCSPEMEEKLARLLQEEKFDLVQVECGWMGQYNIPSQIQKVIRKHDINFIREYARFRTQKNIRKKGILFLYFLSTWYYERKVLRKFDKIIAVSDKDRDKLRRIFHHPNVDFCDPGIDTKSYMPMDLKEEENSLIFVGHIAHFPNEDAMLYFSGEILPLIKKEIHDVKLYIVGSYPTPEILNLRDRNIIVTGQVPDIRPYLAKCQLFIVPVRAGAGIRMKILHAWAMGKPVISTRVGTSGLDARDGENIVLADSPKEFAQKVIYLLRNKSIRRQLGQKGRETVEKKYDWQFAGQKMKNIYEEMLREINT